MRWWPTGALLICSKKCKTSEDGVTYKEFEKMHDVASCFTHCIPSSILQKKGACVSFYRGQNIHVYARACHRSVWHGTRYWVKIGLECHGTSEQKISKKKNDVVSSTRWICSWYSLIQHNMGQFWLGMLKPRTKVYWVPTPVCIKSQIITLLAQIDTSWQISIHSIVATNHVQI